MKDISFQFNRCRLRCFEWYEWKQVPLARCDGYEEALGDVLDLDLNACENLIGFEAKDMARHIAPRIKEVRSIKRDVCGQ